MLPVTKPFLPPINDYLFQIKRVFKNEWLTNRGELVIELEKKIQSFLRTNNVPLVMNNGTIPIQIALKILGLGGEVITTPFSYVATTSSIIWESCIPVFVDIDPLYWTIDDTKIEAVITERTTCILATHVFGNPCNVHEIERIAQKYNISVIYDAAHCFGVKYKDQSIFNWGDVSTCSFHATKVFHTGEGGAAFVNNKELYDKIYYSHNFGHNGPELFHGLGINGKISELNAAMGLSIIPFQEEIIKKRLEICQFYRDNLDPYKFEYLNLRKDTDWNGSYFPIVFKSEVDLLQIISKFNDSHIYARRYFYPSLNTLPYVDKVEMYFAESLSKRILCLPVFHTISDNQLLKIIKILNGFSSN